MSDEDGRMRCDAAAVHCTVCGHAGLERNLDFGLQPLSTGFAIQPAAENESARWPLTLGHCRQCFAIQLVDRFPVEALQGKHPVNRFREPEDHLAEVVNTLKALGVLAPRSPQSPPPHVMGLSDMDQDLIRLLVAYGYITQAQVFDFAVPGLAMDTGLETLQARVCDQDSIDLLVRAQGQVELVCARFLLEHATSAQTFLRSLMRAVSPGGYILLEVPDVAKMLDAGNHALIWEDHFTYFTSGTLLRLAQIVGCEVVSLERYPYPYEDALVVILRVNHESPTGSRPAMPPFEDPRPRLEAFSASFATAKAACACELAAVRASGCRIAAFGAGHHAVKYINFHKLGDLLEFVIDDNPVKIGLYVAGTSLQVRPSSALSDAGIRLCLSGLSPAIEEVVRARLPIYFDRGGEFLPMFRTGKEGA